MPSKRDVLSVFTAHELRDLIDANDLQAAERRRKSALVDALAADGVDLAAILESTFSRDHLKALCRKLSLEDGGRAKAVLVERLLAIDEPAPEPAPEPKPKKRGRKGARATVEKALSAEDVAHQARDAAKRGALSRELLERHLWSAADILRGSIDSSDYKHFIFGLLFLKRLSDRFDEESEALRAEGLDPDDSDEHEFWVSEDAHWSTIRKATENVGEVLNVASNCLEEENEPLDGVLAGIDFNDELKLGDARQRDSTLHRLVISVNCFESLR